MNSIVEDILMHYGMPRRSGRYPYGSGENPYQHSGDFLSRVQELKKSGMSETDIAKNMGLTTTQLRTQILSFTHFCLGVSHNLILFPITVIVISTISILLNGSAISIFSIETFQTF